MANIGHSPFLIMRMLEGWDWFDNRLREQVRRKGYRAFNKTQSMMIIYVANGLRRPADIARQINLSRQAVLHMADQLIKAEILEAHPDPEDGRSKILKFNPKSYEMRMFAENVLHNLEKKLTEKIGAEDMRTLRRILKDAWAEESRPRRKSGAVARRRAERRDTAETIG
jgi:DNA-binding MarR family transcriptional regulator